MATQSRKFRPTRLGSALQSGAMESTFPKAGPKLTTKVPAGVDRKEWLKTEAKIQQKKAQNAGARALTKRMPK